MIKSKPKERPILFSGPMVRAILEGHKTQTRRVLPIANFWDPPVTHWEHWFQNRWKPVREGVTQGTEAKCPYGKPGDRLWVRERARLVEADDGSPFVSGCRPNARVRVRYEADGTLSDWLPYPTRLASLGVGRCVPNGCYREASRITLEITDVRVERVQAISEEDARAEGFPSRSPFAGEWDAIYAAKGLGWDANPWVWVVEFRRVEGEQ